MLKWEYKILDLNNPPPLPETSTVLKKDYIYDLFIELGDNGWELVSVDNDKAYFKRLKVKKNILLKSLGKC